MPIRTLTGIESSRVMVLLEQHFDKERGCYWPDWSDERIAAEADVPRQHVRNRRNKFFGSIYGMCKPENVLPLILAHFDKKMGTYEEGWSDDRIAKEVGGMSQYY